MGNGIKLVDRLGVGSRSTFCTLLGRKSDGQKRKANGEETCDQISQPPKEVGERQNPRKAVQEEVRTASKFHVHVSVCV
jgi:hypothetical protein